MIYSLGQALTADGRAREDGIGQTQGERGFEAREIFGDDQYEMERHRRENVAARIGAANRPRNR